MSPERHSKASLSAVLLDLDDTLYPERDFVRGGFRAAAKLLAERLPSLSRRVSDRFAADDSKTSLASRVGVPACDLRFEQLFLQHFEQGTRGSIFDKVLADLGLPHEATLIDELVRAYRTHEPQLTLFSDADRLLTWLESRQGLGILTDGPADVQRRKVRALDLPHRVEAIVYSDDFGREHWKPSSIPYLELLRRLHAEPSHAVYVGDNPKKDFVGARRLGLQTVRIRRPNTEHGHAEPQPGFEADHEITSLDALPHWLAANTRSERHAA
ncbi:MAG: HAD family hydrolase [Planctomycetaceae bacterium]